MDRSKKLIEIRNYYLYHCNAWVLPAIVSDSNNSDILYKVWYSKYKDGYWKIKYATSKDKKHWIGQTVLDLGNSEDFDNNSVYNPSVIHNPDNPKNPYKMWYAGYNGSYDTIGYATSPDGKHWDKQGKVLDLGMPKNFDSCDVCCPSVIHNPDSSKNPYKMWYIGYDGQNNEVGYAISSDGKHWDKQGKVLDSTILKDLDNWHIEDSYLVNHNLHASIYRNLYNIYYRICSNKRPQKIINVTWGKYIHEIIYAISRDGKHWAKQSEKKSYINEFLQGNLFVKTH